MVYDGPKYHLYFDDSGSRFPDHEPAEEDIRRDKMDGFALGGVLIKAEEVDEIYKKHKEFCAAWKIDYPLHSSKIRGGRNEFGWLKKPEDAREFLNNLEAYILSLPIIGVACVVDRPGYVQRYKERYKADTWLMCKTSFSILIERSAKFVDSQGRKLEVYFEQSGRKEDRDIKAYMKDLKTKGSPFSNDTSGAYKPLKAEDYKRIILGEPHQRTKAVPMIQIADLVLYPMRKYGYDKDYRPYHALKKAGKLIDCYLKESDIPNEGIKYSCFDEGKK